MTAKCPNCQQEVDEWRPQTIFVGIDSQQVYTCRHCDVVIGEITSHSTYGEDHQALNMGGWKDKLSPRERVRAVVELLDGPTTVGKIADDANVSTDNARDHASLAKRRTA